MKSRFSEPLKWCVITLLFMSPDVFFSCSGDIVDTTGSIHGIITNSRTSEPIAGATVAITPGNKSVLTGADGNYSFKDMESREYTIQVTKEGYKSNSRTVTVSPGMDLQNDIQLTPAEPVLNVTQGSLDFGNNATSLTLDISNTGLSALEWWISEDISWLSCNPVSGTVPVGASASVVVSVNRTGLDKGNYSQTVAISSNGGSKIINVSMSVMGLEVKVTPEALNFGNTLTSQTFSLTNLGNSTLNYQLTASNDWLLLSKTSGTLVNTDNITVMVVREMLSEGDYSGSITLTVGDQSLNIPVFMTILPKTQPTLTTPVASEISYNSATLNGMIVSIGSSKVTKHGFAWSPIENPNIETSETCDLGDCSDNSKEFKYVITNLSANTTYYLRSYAKNEVGISYSNQIAITTLGIPQNPTVETGSASNIQAKSFQVSGNLTNVGNVNEVTHYGHVWSTTPHPAQGISSESDFGKTSNTIPFVSEVKDLKPNTLYYVRGYAINSIGIGYGEEISVLTLVDEAKLQTLDATDVSFNAASCHGMITYDGGNVVSERGFCYSTSANPTLEASCVTSSEQSASFSARINNLQPKTTYHVKAYIRTEQGMVYYGNDITFDTSHEVNLPQLGSVKVDDITIAGALFKSSLLSTGEGIVTDAGFVISLSPAPTILNTKLNEGVSLSGGSIAVKAFGLIDNTKYYVRAYAVNEAGVGYSEETSFSTLKLSLATLSDVEVNTITNKSAMFHATVSNDGNGNITDAGFCYATSPNPTFSDEHVSCGKVSILQARGSGLTPTTTYYIRAYAVNERGTSFSEEFSFRTREDGSSIDLNDYGEDKRYDSPVLQNE